MRFSGRAIVMVVALLSLAACGVDRQNNEPHHPATGANRHGKIDVLDAVFVLNTGGSATLSAKVVNNLAGNSQEIREVDLALVGSPADPGLPSRFFDDAASRHHRFSPGKASSIGRLSDDVQIRVASGATVGSFVRATIFFDTYDVASDDTAVTITVPVVARTPAYDSVAGKDGNRYITVRNGKIVVISGQKRAYVDGNVISTVDDAAYEVPTAVDSSGKPVKYRHQTATGGPYGLFADRNKVVPIGSPPYTTSLGDADYVDSNDVTIGEKITVTIPFQSGDVKAVFTVVTG